MSSLAIQFVRGDTTVGFGLTSGWWVLLLGWPAIAGAFVAFAVAVARRSRVAALVGCALAAPMFLYLSLMPGLIWLAMPALGLLLVLAWRVERSSRLVSVLLTLPAAGIVGWLAFVVVTR